MVNTKRNAKVIKKQETPGVLPIANAISLLHGNCYISVMSTTILEHKTQKSLLGTRLRGCPHDLTKILGLDSLQVSQILNTTLSIYEHNRPFSKASGRQVGNTNLVSSINKALFTKI